MNDNPYIDYIQVPLALVQAIDNIVKLQQTHGSDGGDVEHERDWDALISLYKLWKEFYPEEHKDFVKSCETYRQTYIWNKGISKEKGGAVVQHYLEMPETLHQMLKVIFPNIKYTRKFAKKLVEKLPDFSLGINH